MKKTLIQIYKERNNIIEGLTNKVFKKEHVEEIYNERLETCNVCEFKDNEGSKCAVPGTGPCCEKCGCSLSLKLRSLSSSCPILKWGAVLNSLESVLINKSIQENDKTEKDNN